ncbi:MAG: SDR family oxidoreductase, partial [Gammaproteobacteria bacterium]|nr:SDR family oxidoreductase [Gammaproteobacteria bacterium]
MINLKKQVAIITGGGSGIGRAVALALAEVGAKVVICGRRLAPLEQVVQDISPLAGAGLAIQADVSDEEAVQQVIETTIKQFGAVDILINNAGIGGGSYIHKHDVAAWDQIMAVNLRGPFLFARYVLPLMRSQRSGHIINISSESGLEYYEGNGAYGVVKHALNALGEFIQRENQEHHIRVNTICPGMVITEMTEQSPGLNHNKSLQGEDIAELVLWLLTR